MDRDEAYKLAKSKFSNKNLFKHVLAVEAVMKGLAEHFSEDQHKWGLAGLLHDLDYEETKNEPDRHTLLTEDLLKKYDLDPEIIEAIKCHNDKAPRNKKIGKAIYAADPVTGLIVAAALMHPEKKLKALEVDFILRRFDEKRFAAGASREQIKTCEDLGLTLAEFLEIALQSMQSINEELEL